MDHEQGLVVLGSPARKLLLVGWWQPLVEVEQARPGVGLCGGAAVLAGQGLSMRYGYIHLRWTTATSGAHHAVVLCVQTCSGAVVQTCSGAVMQA